MIKTTVGGKEHVILHGKDKERTVLARVDTGATKSSIDIKIAEELGWGPVLRMHMVKSAHGSAERGIVMGRITVAGRTFKVYFTVTDRKHMKYSVLIGRNILKRGFLVDVARKLR